MDEFMSSSFFDFFFNRSLSFFELSNKFHRVKKNKAKGHFGTAFTLDSCLPLKHSIFVEMM